MKPRLHLLGLAHTITTDEFSHCAFTGKVKKFSPMMRSVGYDVIHYGVEGADSGANEQIDVISADEWNSIRTKLLLELQPDRDVNDKSKFIGDLANVGNELYIEFNDRLRYHLSRNVDKNDIICLPFGFANQSALEGLTAGIKVETGIGYPNSYEKYRIFESYAWYHAEAGKQGVSGNDYWWVIPNYFISSDWQLNTKPARYVAYFGRLESIKGLDIVFEIARHRPDLTFILCGQGDPTPYLELPNIIYQGPIHGTARSDFLGNAMAVLMPTRYIEPFGGVTVEAQLCGTPVLGSTWGSFTETIVHGFNGVRCHTLGDYLAALEAVEDGEFDRSAIREFAVAKYDYLNVAHQYDKVFNQLQNLSNGGWYNISSYNVNRAVDYSVDNNRTAWAEQHKAYWDSYINKTLNWTHETSILLASKLGVFDIPVKETDVIVEVGGGPFSVLPYIKNCNNKIIVDPAYYGQDEVDGYEKFNVQYAPQTYETFFYKSDYTILINTISWVESYQAVIQHACQMSNQIFIADILDIELYNDFYAFITSICESTGMDLQELFINMLDNKVLFGVCIRKKS